MKHSGVPLYLTGMILLLIAAVPVTADLSTITTISPAVGYTNGKTMTVAITGVNFTTSEPDVRFEMSGEDDIDATILDFNESYIECRIRILSTIETGDWDIVVTRGYDDLEILKEEAFTITDPMTLTSISPTSAVADDDTVDFTLAGTNLDNVEEVFLYNEDYDDNITAGDVDVASSTKITGTFDLTDAADDTYAVCVEDSYGTVECDLSFAISTDEVGSIDISSSPSGASIYVDGTLDGTTPDTVDDLIEGSHKVILKMSGYQDWGKMVTVTAGDTSEVDADLVVTTTAATPVPTYMPAPVRTPPPATTKPTRTDTLQVPTPWPGTTAATTQTSPVDPALIILATGLGLGFVVHKKP
jgi:hypothetical protein